MWVDSGSAAGAAFSSAWGQLVILEREYNASSGFGQFYLKCPEETRSDHAVVIVGYGRKLGRDVWVVKNSWSERWGLDGHFFVEVGSNSHCMLQEHFAFVPRGVDAERQIKVYRGS